MGAGAGTAGAIGSGWAPFGLAVAPSGAGAFAARNVFLGDLATVNEDEPHILPHGCRHCGDGVPREHPEARTNGDVFPRRLGHRRGFRDRNGHDRAGPDIM